MVHQWWVTHFTSYRTCLVTNFIFRNRAGIDRLILPTFKRLSQINEGVSFFIIEVFVYILSLIAVTVGFASLLIRYISKRTLLSNINKKSNLHLSGWFYKSSILFQLFIGIAFVFCTFGDDEAT